MAGLHGRRASGPGQSYLVIRPLSENPGTVAPYVRLLTELTGLDPATVRQKFTGNALQVLRSHPDETALQTTLLRLRDAGFPAVLIHRTALLRARRPERVVGLDRSRGRLGLLSLSGNLLQSLDGSQRCLLVLSSLNIEKLRDRRMAKLAMTGAARMPRTELFRLIFQGHPIMALYIDGVATPYYFDAFRFHFGTLGDQNRKAVALNFPVLIGMLRQHARETWIDTGFGQNLLPFLHSFGGQGSEQTLRQFFEYAAFVSLASDQGIFRQAAPHEASLPLPDGDALAGLFWAGPLVTSNTPPDTKDSALNLQPRREPEPAASALPPPQPAENHSVGSLSTIVRMPRWLRQHFRTFVHHVGPPFLIYPLSLTALGALWVGRAQAAGLSYAIALIAVGLVSFVHAFVLLARKRAIENCPTSRVRSMPMGLVELKGRARQKYSLKAPFSLTDCVYYSYKRYEWEHVGNQGGYRLKQWGESGHVPFYLEDETGRVLIQPQHAIIKAGTTQEMSAPFGNSLGAMELYSDTGNQKIVEKVIPMGEPLYVMGFARPLRTARDARESLFRKKLRKLKNDPERLQNYDLNGDGAISDTEWERARRELQNAALLESAGDGRDRVCISEHPTGGLFYISDTHEEHLTRSMGWRIPLFAGLGMGLVIGALAFMFKP